VGMAQLRRTITKESTPANKRRDVFRRTTGEIQSKIITMVSAAKVVKQGLRNTMSTPVAVLVANKDGVREIQERLAEARGKAQVPDKELHLEQAVDREFLLSQGVDVTIGVLFDPKRPSIFPPGSEDGVRSLLELEKDAILVAMAAFPGDPEPIKKQRVEFATRIVEYAIAAKDIKPKPSKKVNTPKKLAENLKPVIKVQNAFRVAAQVLPAQDLARSGTPEAVAELCESLCERLTKAGVEPDHEEIQALQRGMTSLIEEQGDPDEKARRLVVLWDRAQSRILAQLLGDDSDQDAGSDGGDDTRPPTAMWRQIEWDFEIPENPAPPWEPNTEFTCSWRMLRSPGPDADRSWGRRQARAQPRRLPDLVGDARQPSPSTFGGGWVRVNTTKRRARPWMDSGLLNPAPEPKRTSTMRTTTPWVPPRDRAKKFGPPRSISAPNLIADFA